MGDNIEWSSDQMIENASNWSLAGDVAVLNSLKKFSQSLLSETEELNQKVDDLLNNLEHVGLKLELTRNEFHSLRNTQFIENRVYEDDETVENFISNKAGITELTEEDKELSVKKAIANGLKVMEKYFDKVELSISDSEGDENDQSYVLKPKDPYIDRPLPYLIGTEEWQKKWHVGLLPSDNESESEKEQDVYSSDSDTTLPKNVIIGSETSSELDFTNRNTGGPVANSTFNDSKDSRQDNFESSDDDSTGPPVRETDNFAEQLAAKLGDVITGRSNQTPVVSQQQNFGSLFSDQPPPIGDPDETILPKPANEGLFSGGRDLFSENVGAGSLWNADNAPKTSSSHVKTSKGLFSDSDSSSEEDVLAITERRKLQSSGKPANPYLHHPKTNLPFLDEQPPEITTKTEGEPPKKKPVGGVSLFGDNPNIFQPKIPKQEPEPVKKPLTLFDNSSEDEEIFLPKKIVKPERQETGKKLNLFDDSEDESEVEIVKPKPSTSTKKIISLFDDDDDLLKEEEDLFAAVNKKNSSTHAKSLFDDFEDSSSFDTEKKPIEEGTSKVESKTRKSLFDDLESSNEAADDLLIPTSNKPAKSLFDDLESSNVSPKSEVLKPTPKEKPESKVQEEVTKGLFDDLESSTNAEEDLFTVPKETKKPIPKQEPDLYSSEAENSTTKMPPKVEPEIKKSLFDDLAEDDLFTPDTSTKQTTNKELPVKVEQGITKSLFDDLESSVKAEDDLFTIKKAKTPQDVNTDSETKESIKRTAVSLFDDSDAEKSFEEDVFAKPAESISNVPHLEPAVTQPSVLKKSVSFDDGYSEEAKMEGQSGQKGEEREVEESASRVEPPPFNMPPAINVFDPTPPPVDWDALSDNSADSDKLSLTDGILERTSYASHHTVSSIFDEAPPSLVDMNYSSGIVKDGTRLDTDDSSFYPYATSSRRRSSEVFAEQQSQDSFFVTKNRTDSGAPAPILEQISENSESQSKIEYLTTSGLEEDFEGSNSVFEHDSVEKNDEDVMAPPPPVLQRASFLTDKPEETATEKPKPSARTSPGKLKHNLNINVGALLPGAAPVKPKIVVENLDETDQIPKPVVRRPARAGSAAVRPKSEISSSFVGVGDTEVLQSVTKDRAKIPVKRRPSTRRARQEAVRKSMTDFSLYKSPESEGEEEKVPVQPAKTVSFTDTLDKPLQTTETVSKQTSDGIFTDTSTIQPLSSKTTAKQSIFEDSFEDDLFKAPATTKQDVAAAKIVNPDTMFDSAGSEDEDLFKDLKNVEKKVEETKPVQIARSGLFADKSDSDSDSGLFSATHKSKIVSAAKSSLFDDSGDSSEDDLFGVKTSGGKPAVSTLQGVASNKKPTIKTNVKKLENKPVTDFDPLSGFK